MGKAWPRRRENDAANTGKIRDLKYESRDYGFGGSGAGLGGSGKGLGGVGAGLD